MESIPISKDERKYLIEISQYAYNIGCSGKGRDKLIKSYEEWLRVVNKEAKTETVTISKAEYAALMEVLEEAETLHNQLKEKPRFLYCNPLLNNAIKKAREAIR
jgi:hypothetical protein